MTGDAPNEVVVRTRGLTKVFKRPFRDPVRALDSLDLEIRRGEVFGLLGPNGSGKTTTTKLLLGLLFPTDGEATVLGARPGTTAAKTRIGYLPEESYLYRFLNADETLKFYGRLFGLGGADLRDRVDRLVRRVGLEEARRRKLKEYSKGMARRIGLAQALINDPDLVILDEPTSGLDPLGTREVKDLMLELKREGRTVLLCSHLLADVQSVCDRIAILHRGVLRTAGEVRDLLTDRDVLELRLARVPEDRRPDLIAAVEELAERLSPGARLTRADHPRDTLEELFLRVVEESTRQGEEAAK